MEQNSQNRRSYSNERNTNQDQDRYNQGYGSFRGYDNDDDFQNRSGRDFGRNNDFNNQRNYGQDSGRYNDMNDSGWNWGSQSSGSNFGISGRYGNQDFNRGGSSDRSRDFDTFSNSDYGQRSSGRGWDNDDFGSDFDNNRSRSGFGQRRNQFGNDFDRNQDFGRQSYGRHNQSQDYGRNNYNDDYGRNRNYGNFDRNDRYGNYDRNDRNDRGWWDRTKDEVSSWFGDDDAERRRQMDERRDRDYRGESHRGKGPKDYQRSQERIREDVSDRLSDAHDIDASHIEVKVEGTEVILSGHVNSKSQKRRAEDIAEQVSGVKNVQNHLRVGDPNESGSHSGGTTMGTNENKSNMGTTTGNTSSSSTTTGSATTGKSGSNDNKVKTEKANLS